MSQLDAIELETAPAVAASVIWMHGLGADGNDFAGIAGEFDLPSEPGVRFIFPHAPMMPVTINGGYVMRAWYDISGDDLTRREDEAGVRASGRRIEAIIEREVARGVAAEKIILAGFSQGGAIALHTALRHPRRLAGVLALSTYLPIAHSLAAEAHPANRDVPILMAHGSADPIVGLSMATRSRDAILKLGYPLQWREYLMEHSVCGEEIDDIGAWLKQVLGLTALA